MSEIRAPGGLERRSSAATEPGPRPRLVEAAYAAIKEAIRTGALPPGFQAAEAEIARRLGMSRTPVHEAMARLEEEGVVRILPKRGILVLSLSVDDVAEIYEMIAALEGAAAERLAAADAAVKAPVLAVLAAATAAMEAALAADADPETGLEQGLDRWAEADAAFHHALVAGSGNRRLARAAATVTELLDRTRVLTVTLRPRPTPSAADHHAVIRAIRDGDAEAAGAAARGHRRRAAEGLLPLLARLSLPSL